MAGWIDLLFGFILADPGQVHPDDADACMEYTFVLFVLVPRDVVLSIYTLRPKSCFCPSENSFALCPCREQAHVSVVDRPSDFFRGKAACFGPKSFARSVVDM